MKATKTRVTNWPFLKLVIITIFVRKFGPYLAFFIFRDLAFLKLLMAKFGFFDFFRPGNPGEKGVEEFDNRGGGIKNYKCQG